MGLYPPSITDDELRAVPVPVATLAPDAGLVALLAGLRGAGSKTLADIVTALASVGLDAATLAALESITVQNNIVLDAASLAALESITVQNNVATDMLDRAARLLGVLSASENHLGEVGGLVVPVVGSVTRPNDATPYTANDVISTAAGAPLTFANAARAAARGGYIVKAYLACSNVAAAHVVRLHLFGSTPVGGVDVTSLADNAPFALLSLTNYLGYFDFPVLVSIGGFALAQYNDLRFMFGLTSGSTVYGVLAIQTAAVTPNNSSVYTVRLGIDQT